MATCRSSWAAGAGFLTLAVLAGGCATPPAPVPEPARPPAPAPAPAPVAILVSDEIGAYKEVAAALDARLTHVRVHALHGDARKAEDTIQTLRRISLRGVVAIGALATRAAARLADPPPVVFCLDFTPKEARAGRAAMRGVRAQPPPFEQLRAWKELDPRLRRVAMVTGKGKSAFVREALAAAGRAGIELEHIEVQSDRELRYVVKRLDPEVQGVWFPPDSRVLSAAALREVLAHTLRQGKQTLVFTSQLLQYGALISVEADPDDVAERVVEQLRATAETPRVLSLRRVQTRVNPEVARQFGLAIPEDLQGGAHVF